MQGGKIIVDSKIKTTASLPIVSIEASEDNPNVYRIAAAKVGSASYGPDGQKFIFSRKALETCAHTWEGGIVTLNHAKIDGESTIKASVFDPETELVYQDIEVLEPETSRRVQAGEPTGVSIEADILDVDESNEVQAFDGTGVSIIFYPEMPACPLKDGCGILAKEQYDKKVEAMSDKRAEKITAKTYDLARVNNMGLPVKIDTVVIWEDEIESKEVDDMLSSFVGYHGPGSYELYSKSDSNVGDVLGDADNPEYNVSISVSSVATTPGGDSITPKPEDTVSKEEYDKVVASLKEVQDELESVKASETTKEYEAIIAAKDTEIDDLKSQLQEIHNAKASALVDEIVKIDEDFSPEGLSLEQIEKVHASLTRVSTKIKASVPKQKAEAAEFDAPDESYATDGSTGLTIGGLVDGTWQGPAKPASVSAYERGEE